MIGINTNIAALNASAKLSSNALEQATAMQRLSTGLRVNSAKDDAAALAISTGFMAQTRGMTQAIRNVQDGIGLAQTAESTVTSAINMVQRMRELALQSANGTLTDANRHALQLEFDANINEINNALNVSNFNGIKLFDGSASNLKIQTGANVGETKTISIPRMTSLSILGVAGTEFLNGGQTNPPPSIYTSTTNQVYTSTNTNNYVDPVYIDPNVVVTGVGTIDGASVVMSNGDLGHDVLQLTNPPFGITASYDNTTGILKLSGTATIADYQDALRHVQFKTDATAAAGKRSFDINVGTAVKGPNGHYYQYIDKTVDFNTAITLAENTNYFGMKGYLATSTNLIENQFLTSLCNNTRPSWIGASDDYQLINKVLGSNAYTNQSQTEGNWFWITGPEAGIQISNGDLNPISTSYSNWLPGEPNNLTMNDPAGEQAGVLMTFPGQEGGWVDLNNAGNPNSYFVPGMLVEYNGDPNLHITANTTIDVGANWHPPITVTPTPELQVIPDVTTAAKAIDSLAKLDTAIGALSDIRSYLGAVQNTLAAMGDNLTESINNAQQSNGRIMDTDYTVTTTELSRTQIINQASTAMLAQANQAPQLVLQLLKNNG